MLIKAFGKKAFMHQIPSLRAEAKDIAPLVEQGPRRPHLERSAFGLEGQIADANANVAMARRTCTPRYGNGAVGEGPPRSSFAFGDRYGCLRLVMAYQPQ